MGAACAPPSGGPPPTAGPSYDTGLEPLFPAVEIYRVGAASRPAAGALLTGFPLAGTLRVSGGPDSVLSLMNAGLLDNGTATVLAADPAAPTAGTRPAVTDGLRRQEIDFGKPTDHTSATLAPTDSFRLKRAANGYDLFPGTGGGAGGADQTVAGYVGVKDIRASSSGSDIIATYSAGLDRLPYAALHNNAGTFWVSANTGSVIGQWIEVDLDTPVSIPAVSVNLLNGALMGGAVSAIQVTTDSGSVTVKVPFGNSVQSLPLPPGPATHIRLTAAAASGPGLFALTGLRIPGVDAQRTLVAPAVPVAAGSDGADTVYAFTRSPHGGGCIDIGKAPACAASLVRGGEDIDALDRTFTAGAGQELDLTGTVRATQGPELEKVLQQSAPLKVTASSQLVSDPRVRAGQVADRAGEAPWIAGGLDPDPKITFSWTGQRTLTELDLAAASTTVASTPRSVLLVSPHGTRRAAVPSDGVIRFDPLTTDTITVSFPEVRRVTAEVPAAAPVTLPVGVRKLRFPALDTLARPVDDAARLPAKCGDGPAIRIDDAAPIATEVVGTFGAALDGRPLTLQPCDPAGTPLPSYRLAAGTHRIRVADTAAYSAETLNLAPTASVSASTASAPAREQSVVTWSGQSKTVRVGAGDTWLLVLHQNANPGWRAELDGHVLRPVTVDGWQQAWLVPAGSGGLVRISYPPDRLYRAGLAVGAVAALALLAVAFVPRRRRDRRLVDPRPLGDSPAAAAGLTAVALLALAGPWAILPATVGFLLARAPRSAAAIAGGGYAVAGVLLAWRAHGGSGSLQAADRILIATLCLIVVGAAVAETLWKRQGHDV
jgi:arabinofuranan 3-O-arabinosyltransferase